MGQKQSRHPAKRNEDLLGLSIGKLRICWRGGTGEGWGWGGVRVGVEVEVGGSKNRYGVTDATTAEKSRETKV